MFIDECGEANVSKPDPRFNLFSLCAVIFRHDEYVRFNDAMKAFKIKIFGDDGIVFHSFTMRNKRGKFVVFKQDDVMKRFYHGLSDIVNSHHYYIISAIVNKELYKARYPAQNYAYEESFRFLCERAFFIMKKAKDCTRMHICLEDRSKGLNRLVKKQYNKLKTENSRFYQAKEFDFCYEELKFRKKVDNINGLQFADICAYPIIRAITSPEKIQPTFELIKHRIYADKNGSYKGYGVKVFPQ